MISFLKVNCWLVNTSTINLHFSFFSFFALYFAINLQTKRHQQTNKIIINPEWKWTIFLLTFVYCLMPVRAIKKTNCLKMTIILLPFSITLPNQGDIVTRPFNLSTIKKEGEISSSSSFFHLAIGIIHTKIINFTVKYYLMNTSRNIKLQYRSS